MKLICPIYLFRSQFAFCLLLMACLMLPGKAESQVLRVLANNTFAGTVNGAMLGGATMALTDNSGNFRPVQIGVGMGTLSGMGIGAYDASQDHGYVQGTFSTVNSTGYIILFDTFYGAATGTVAGMAIALLGNHHIGKGMQYGAGAGAWAGFSFGLIDAFYLSYRTPESDLFTSARPQVNGLLQIHPAENYHIGLIHPSVYAFPELDEQALTVSSYFGFEIASLSFRF